MLLGHVTAAWSTSRTSSPAGRLLLEDKAADRARRGSGRRHWHSGGWTFSPADRHAVPEPLWAAPHLQAAAKRQVTPRVTHEASKSQSPTCWEALKWAEGTWGGPSETGSSWGWPTGAAVSPQTLPGGLASGLAGSPRVFRGGNGCCCGKGFRAARATCFWRSCRPTSSSRSETARGVPGIATNHGGCLVPCHLGLNKWLPTVIEAVHKINF